MAFEVIKTFVIKAPPAAVWDFLTDPQRVARCLPGAAISEKIDDKTWAGTMTVKVGPVSSSYKGKVVFQRLDAATRTAEIVATGQDVRGKGGADLRLTSTVKEVAPGGTEVTAAAKVNITGILAQMGRGMVQDVSDQMFQVFSQRMRSELETAQAPVPAPSPAAAAPAASGPASAATSSSAPEALDLGSLGAQVAGRAAARAVQRPGFWVAAVGLAFLVYLLFR
jgi:carbon monoxide dehydrogenase subunit G